jgi:hypothetical protein
MQSPVRRIVSLVSLVLLLPACEGREQQHEVSLNLDLENLNPLLELFGARMQGFGATEIATVRAGFDRLRDGESHTWTFQIQHDSKPTPIRIEVLREDPQALILAIWTSAALASELDGLLDAFMQERGM